MELILITESGSEYRLDKGNSGTFSVSKKGEKRSNVLVGIGMISTESAFDVLTNELKSSVHGRASGYYNRPNSFNGLIIDKGDIISLESFIGSKIFFTSFEKDYMCKEILASCPLSFNLIKQHFGFSTKIVQVYVE